MAFALEEMQNYRIVFALKDLWSWTKKFNKPDSLYLRESFCCKRKREPKAEQSKFCTGWCAVQQSEKQRWNNLPINPSIQQSWKLALALVILFCTRFLLKAIRRYPSGELRFRVVLCIMKGFLFVLFTLLVLRPLLFGGLWFGLLQIRTDSNYSPFDKSSNISTWFAFLRAPYFSPCLLSSSPLHIMRPPVK